MPKKNINDMNLNPGLLPFLTLKEFVAWALTCRENKKNVCAFLDAPSNLHLKKLVVALSALLFIKYKTNIPRHMLFCPDILACLTTHELALTVARLDERELRILSTDDRWKDRCTQELRRRLAVTYSDKNKFYYFGLAACSSLLCPIAKLLMGNEIRSTYLFVSVFPFLYGVSFLGVYAALKNFVTNNKQILFKEDVHKLIDFVTSLFGLCLLALFSLSFGLLCSPSSRIYLDLFLSSGGFFSVMGFTTSIFSLMLIEKNLCSNRILQASADEELEGLVARLANKSLGIQSFVRAHSVIGGLTPEAGMRLSAVSRWSDRVRQEGEAYHETALVLLHPYVPNVNHSLSEAMMR